MVVWFYKEEDVTHRPAAVELPLSFYTAATIAQDDCSLIRIYYVAGGLSSPPAADHFILPFIKKVTCWCAICSCYLP